MVLENLVYWILLPLLFKQTLGHIYYDGQDTLDRKGNKITLPYCPQEGCSLEMTHYEHIEMLQQEGIEALC